MQTIVWILGISLFLAILTIVFLVYHRIQWYRIVNILLQNPEFVKSVGFDKPEWWRVSYDYKVLGHIIKLEMLYEFLRPNLPGLAEIREKIFYGEKNDE